MIVLPIFLVTNFPALYLMDKLTPAMAVWGMAAPLLLLGLTRVVFKRAIRRYESASG
jgi:ABC-2 type transport system permease protein